jgi:hypothetical protein
MRGLVVAVVVVMLGFQGSVHADLNARDRALLAQAQQTGVQFFQAVSARDERAIRSFMLSPGEARAYFTAAADPARYNAYVRSTWAEIRELLAGAQRIHAQRKSISLVGVEVVNWMSVSGREYARPTLLVTAKPVFSIDNKRVVGPDVIRLVRINNYWKISGMFD